MALDLDRASELAGGQDSGPGEGSEETVIYAQDVKCLLCGAVLGQLVGRPRLPPDARHFRPSVGTVVPPGFRPGRAHCFRCGGPCFLDEVETIVKIREEAFEKPRRGRKPKARPADATLL